MSRSLYISQAGWYSLKYPPAWEVEEDEACVTIYDPHNGVGALQISAYRTPDHQNPKSVLLEHLSDDGVTPDRKRIKVHKNNGKTVASYNYVESPWYKKIWFISQDTFLLLITYNCKTEHEGKEAGAVEEIIRSIRLLTERVVTDRRAAR
jgi:uncharacterized protein DUF3805